MAAQDSSRAASQAAAEFAPLSARRLLVLGGIALILAGMIFGGLFAVFVLHQNASRVGASLAAAAHAALRGNAAAAGENFRDIGAFLENRGTKVDTHAHMIAFGYLALMLALVQPWVAFTEKTKKRLAVLFLFGSVLLPVCVFLIHYVGLAHSPLESIGWASIFADLGGLFVIVASLAFFWGLWRHFSSREQPAIPDTLLAGHNAAGRRLFAGGVALILLGFAHGAWYAASDLYAHESADYSILSRITSIAAGDDHDPGAVDAALTAYGQLQGDKAVKIAAHAHLIEFGILAILLAFFQPYVQLRDAWRGRWAGLLLLGSLMLPVFVLLELRWGLIAGGLADFGGLLVIVALFAMWAGILRYTGELDAVSGGAP